MNEIGVGSVLGRRPDVRFRVIDAEGVVVRQSAGEVLVLNDIGTRILALADGVAPVAVWIDTLLVEFEVEVERPARESDVLAFAAELVEQGLLESAPAKPAALATPAPPATPEPPEPPATPEAPAIIERRPGGPAGGSSRGGA